MKPGTEVVVGFHADDKRPSAFMRIVGAETDDHLGLIPGFLASG